MGASSFNRDHHNRIAKALAALNPDIFDQCSCLFGGGTAIALTHGEYRESVDIDFLVSDLGGFRQIRELLTTPEGLRPVLVPGAALELARPIRSSSYKLEALLRVDGVPIKFEVVLEGHIKLDAPVARTCGLSTLTDVDMLATKLMANSDRLFADETNNRDLIDMAMMRPSKDLMAQASAKVRETIYKNSFEPNLLKAIERVQTRAGWLDECLQTMHIDMPKAAMLEAIKRLSPSTAKEAVARRPKP